mmetsp:Transcript_32822/g.82380  ORF Transcript_32822/g.82380 Transcript_32822/m.82380 type:complete len:865 (+) Transcript_32822:335-2929(+)
MERISENIKSLWHSRAIASNVSRFFNYLQNLYQRDLNAISRKHWVGVLVDDDGLFVNFFSLVQGRGRPANAAHEYGFLSFVVDFPASFFIEHRRSFDFVSVDTGLDTIAARSRTLWFGSHYRQKVFGVLRLTLAAINSHVHTFSKAFTAFLNCTAQANADVLFRVLQESLLLAHSTIDTVDTFCFTSLLNCQTGVFVNCPPAPARAHAPAAAADGPDPARPPTTPLPVTLKFCARDFRLAGHANYFEVEHTRELAALPPVLHQVVQLSLIELAARLVLIKTHMPPCPDLCFQVDKEENLPCVELVQPSETTDAPPISESRSLPTVVAAVAGSSPHRDPPSPPVVSASSALLKGFELLMSREDGYASNVYTPFSPAGPPPPPPLWSLSSRDAVSTKSSGGALPNARSGYSPFLSGRTLSTYPIIRQVRMGDPVADCFAAEVYREHTILVVADGCGWGHRAARAAEDAVDGFLAHIKVNLFDEERLAPLNTGLLSRWLRRSVVQAHATVLARYARDELSSCGTTTLLGGVISPLARPSPRPASPCTPPGRLLPISKPCPSPSPSHRRCSCRPDQGSVCDHCCAMAQRRPRTQMPAPARACVAGLSPELRRLVSPAPPASHAAHAKAAAYIATFANIGDCKVYKVSGLRLSSYLHKSLCVSAEHNTPPARHAVSHRSPSSDVDILTSSSADVGALLEERAGDVRVIDLSKGMRPSGISESDPGGWIGGGVKPNMKNLRLLLGFLSEGDVVLLMTDGVHDNLNPLLLGEAACDYGLESWDELALPDSSYTMDALKEAKLLALLREDRPQSPAQITGMLMSHCQRTTEPSQRFLAEKPDQPLPTDYAAYPGKMDHSTCVCYVVGRHEAE